MRKYRREGEDERMEGDENRILLLATSLVIVTSRAQGKGAELDPVWLLDHLSGLPEPCLCEQVSTDSSAQMLWDHTCVLRRHH